MACHCNEFSRAHLFRAATAEAGRGLPTIEPGMPLPAGTGMSRRSFMLRAGLGLMSVYGGSRIGFDQLQAGIAEAQGTTEPVILTVFMDGGMDALSVLAPVKDSNYQSLRGSLRMEEGQGPEFAEDRDLMWHPKAAALDQLHRAGKLSVLPAVGYDDADQSHFTSRHFWEVGQLDANGRTGWLGRLIDRIGSDTNPLQGLSLDGWLSPSLASVNKPVAAIEGSSYDLWAPGVWSDLEGMMFEAVDRIGMAHASSGDLARQTAGRISQRAVTLRDDLKDFGEVVAGPGYPQPDHWFPQNLAALAEMLSQGLPLRCVSMTGPGHYDTHEDQKSSFGNDIGLTFDALAAFQADLEARELADRVITLVFSEFGRRPEQNGTGTDHGAAGAAFVMGTKVNGTMIGEFPGLSRLDEDDNVRHTADFRALYCSILEQWFGQDAAAIIPGASGFARPTVITPPA